MIRKLLIANRGEIAVRVIRAARELGVRTVAVFSEADRDAPHVALADEAVPIGPPEAAKSYLDSDRILRAAKEAKADAIHPGYGFLSESAEFAERVASEGLIFVGPPPAAMRRLGAKIGAKKLAVGAGVPVVPGYFEPGASDAQLRRAAEEIGFPVMLKASGGGGGRGMRIVREREEFDAALRIASDEAMNAFGDGAMMVEKLIERPRHVEVQVIADAHGNVAVLYERECSIQRRHQKLIEECPAPALSRPRPAKVTGRVSSGRRDTRSQGGSPDPTGSPRKAISWPGLREAAIALCRAAGYANAGTIEFMVDESTGEFYFLEVNARLQVEHPVTEMVTGVDLVKWQLRVASGDTLALPPDILEGDRQALRGHAIEARIVAEDPARRFMPCTGRILGWAEPKLPGVRVDTGYGRGAEVSRFYDSLLAKVIAFGETRAEAISRLECALLDFHILGVPTNIAYTLDVLRHPSFHAGEFDTGFLEREFDGWRPASEVPDELGALVSSAGERAQVVSQGVERSGAAWALGDRFRNAATEASS